METYSFNTQNVENKLQDIKCSLHILYFAVNGLKNLELIDNNELAGFEFIIEETNKIVSALLKGMQSLR